MLMRNQEGLTVDLTLLGSEGYELANLINANGGLPRGPEPPENGVIMVIRPQHLHEHPDAIAEADAIQEIPHGQSAEIGAAAIIAAVRDGI